MAASDYDVRDGRFGRLVFGNAHVERLWTGCRWAEGPVHVPAARALIWSDITNDRLLRYDEPSGVVSVFHFPCGFQNGHTLDRAGRVIACEHGGRCVSRIEHDGRRTVLADRFEGRRFNSPNDVVERSDGSVWFSDPTYGIDSDYEGEKAPSEIGASYVYRIDPDGSVAAVVTDLLRPNGLAFSPDEQTLYVADTGRTHDPECAPIIGAYPVSPDGRTIGPGRIFAVCDTGLFDGFRVDSDGNVWASAGDGVHCFAPDGTLLGKIRVPEVVSNVAFGGAKKNRLYITATTSLYAVYVRIGPAVRP